MPQKKAPISRPAQTEQIYPPPRRKLPQRYSYDRASDELVWPDGVTRQSAVAAVVSKEVPKLVQWALRMAKQEQPWTIPGIYISSPEGVHMNDRERALWVALIRAEKELEDCCPDVGMGASTQEIIHRVWKRTQLSLTAHEVDNLIKLAEEI